MLRPGCLSSCSVCGCFYHCLRLFLLSLGARVRCGDGSAQPDLPVPLTVRSLGVRGRGVRNASVGAAALEHELGGEPAQLDGAGAVDANLQVVLPGPPPRPHSLGRVGCLVLIPGAAAHLLPPRLSVGAVTSSNDRRARRGLRPHRCRQNGSVQRIGVVGQAVRGLPGGTALAGGGS